MTIIIMDLGKIKMTANPFIEMEIEFEIILLLLSLSYSTSVYL